jgi:hypothetical protein
LPHQIDDHVLRRTSVKALSKHKNQCLIEPRYFLLQASNSLSRLLVGNLPVSSQEKRQQVFDRKMAIRDGLNEEPQYPICVQQRRPDD